MLSSTFIDEVGYLSFDDKAADLLYEVINRRYERKSVIVTTNRPFKEWNEVFPNATCIATLLDRLLHHADVTVIEGDSYRKRESEQETAARRRKK
jgi:DNA replication protein DnaC